MSSSSDSSSVSKHCVGDPMDKNTDVGAINSEAQLGRISALMNAGIAEGAELWSSSCPLPKNGFYLSPSIFTNATPSMRIAREEIFGPVLTTMTFRTPDEAVSKANNSPYGLSAGVDREGLAGDGDGRGAAVWCDLGQHLQSVRSAASFGGYKESGFGREGGPSGLAAYLNTDDEAVVQARGDP